MKKFKHLGYDIEIVPSVRVRIPELNQCYTVDCKAFIPHELQAGLKEWAKWKIDDAECRKRSPEAWRKQLWRKIDDDKLRSKIANIIWFEFSDLKEQALNKFPGTCVMTWSQFRNLYKLEESDPYFTDKEILKGLDLVGFKHPEYRNNRKKYINNLKRKLHKIASESKLYRMESL